MEHERPERPLVMADVIRKTTARAILFDLMQDVTGRTLFEKDDPWHRAWKRIARASERGIVEE